MYTDMFMFTGEQRYMVKMRMGLLSYNLMLEEYPQSAKCFTADGDTHGYSKAKWCRSSA